MNAEIGFGRRMLTVLESNGISFEHMPSGIDTVCLVVEHERARGQGRQDRARDQARVPARLRSRSSTASR